MKHDPTEAKAFGQVLTRLRSAAGNPSYSSIERQMIGRIGEFRPSTPSSTPARRHQRSPVCRCCRPDVVRAATLLTEHREGEMRVMVVAVAALVLVGCGGESATTTTTELRPEDCGAGLIPRDGECVPLSTTTSVVTRAAIGEAITDAMDPKGILGYLHVQPERYAEMAAAYCSDLERTDRATAEENLTDSLAGFIRAVGGPGNADPRGAAISADLTVGQFAKHAEAQLCPDAGAGGYLPPS